MTAAAPPTVEELPAYLAGVPTVADRLGGGPDGWSVHEVGDGNMNWVYRVDGPRESVCVKLAWPYIRVIGPDWPMPGDRLVFEAATLTAHAHLAPGRTPQLFHVDPQRCVLVMEHLAAHEVLRLALLQGKRFPLMATHVARYAAHAHVGTSVHALGAVAYRQALARQCGNALMCEATEQVIFRDCYSHTDRVRYVSPDLDDIVVRLRTDSDIKLAVSRLKTAFIASPQALLHGDLHTGSVLVTPGDTRIIDHEFSLYGPIGFDVGMFLANLFIAAFAAPAHGMSPTDGRARRADAWGMVEAFWTAYRGAFLEAWALLAVGESYDPALFTSGPDRSAKCAESRSILDQVMRDALGYCAVEIIRRTVGLSHVQEWTLIGDPYLRARLQRPALMFAQDLLLGAVPADLTALIDRAGSLSS